MIETRIDGIERRPEKLEGETVQIRTACGNMYITLNKNEVYPIFEVLCASGKTGSCSAAVVDALNRTISIALRGGIEPEHIIDELENIKCPKSNLNEKSCPEAIATAMKDYLEENYTTIDIEIDNDFDSNEPYTSEEKIDVYFVEENNSNGFEECPECGDHTFNPSADGCAICMSCGYSPCS